MFSTTEELNATIERIETSTLQVSSHSYGLLVQQITSSKNITQGKRLHAHILNQGTDHDRQTFLGNLIIDMYAKFGQLDQASRAFNRIHDKNVFSWNIMIAANALNGHLLEAANLFKKMPVRDTASWSSMLAAYAQSELHGKEAIRLFREMQMEGARPDGITFMSVLDACANMSLLQDGKFVTSVAVEQGLLETDVKVGTALVNMYGKCGSLEEARNLFERMPERNAVTWNTLLTAYVQNGEIEQARDIFAAIPERNVVSWTAMIAGYAQNGFNREALEHVLLMDLDGIKPNENTFLAALDACASLSALSRGRALHARVASAGLDCNLKVATSVVEMYGKCGKQVEAREMFDKMVERTVITWNAMVGSYARFGYWKEALCLFHLMVQEGFSPTWVTYISVLVACSHSGLLKHGKSYFTSMISDHGIEPSIEHYHCMIDVVGRAGSLADAEELIKTMPFHSDAVTWAELVASSKIHGDMSQCERAAENTFGIDPKDPAHFLLSNMYAAAGREKDVRRVRRAMKERGVKNRPGCSYIEVNDKVHEFVAGDSMHPLNDAIRAKSKELHELITEMEGYVADTREMFHQVEEETKREMLRFHSEKMAISLGVLATKAGTPLRVVKNLRVCVDCHTFTKLVSKCLKREVIMRDVNRFHCFTGGRCSCDDYW